MRDGNYVVPKVSARPHGTERNILGITELSSLRVSPSDREIEYHNVESASPDMSTRSGNGSSVAPRKRVTFAETPVSASPVTSENVVSASPYHYFSSISSSRRRVVVVIVVVVVAVQQH